MSQQPVRIIGAGISGLTLGQCLLKHGIPAVLYDKSPSPAYHNYGITLNDYSYKPLLPILGLDEQSFKRRVAVDSNVGGVGRLGGALTEAANRQPATKTFRAHRGRLEALLRHDLDIRWKHVLTGIDSVPSSDSTLTTTLRFANGEEITSIHSSLLVGADGVHSAVRKALGPSIQPSILPFVAYNGRRNVPRPNFNEVYAPLLGGSNKIEARVSSAADPNAVVLLTVSVTDYRDEDDSVVISWVYSRAARDGKKQDDPLWKPNRPPEGASQIPDEFYDEVAGLQDLNSLFKDVFDVSKLRKERILNWLMRTVEADQEGVDGLAKSGVVLMGDAIHAEPILGGQGANDAMEDAMALADMIMGDTTDVCRKWCGSRVDKWRKSIEECKASIQELHR